MTAIDTKTRRAEQKAKRRQEILDAAIELWAVKGSHGTGITAVAERAGMTHAGLLHHFGSKANLRLAVMEERDRRDRRILQRYFDEGDIDTLWDRYPDIARANESEPGLAQLFIILVSESLDPASVGHTYFQQRYRRARRRQYRALRKAQQLGRVRDDIDCVKKAGEVVAFMDGALIQWMLDPKPGDLVELYEDFFGTLAAALATDPGRVHEVSDTT